MTFARIIGTRRLTLRLPETGAVAGSLGAFA